VYWGEDWHEINALDRSMKKLKFFQNDCVFFFIMGLEIFNLKTLAKIKIE
jgi:hypothetical protein